MQTKNTCRFSYGVNLTQCNPSVKNKTLNYYARIDKDRKRCYERNKKG